MVLPGCQIGEYNGKVWAYRKVLLVCKHDLSGVCVIRAIRFIDNEFVFLQCEK